MHTHRHTRARAHIYIHVTFYKWKIYALACDVQPNLKRACMWLCQFASDLWCVICSASKLSFCNCQLLQLFSFSFFWWWMCVCVHLSFSHSVYVCVWKYFKFMLCVIFLWLLLELLSAVFIVYIIYVSKVLFITAIATRTISQIFHFVWIALYLCCFRICDFSLFYSLSSSSRNHSLAVSDMHMYSTICDRCVCLQSRIRVRRHRFLYFEGFYSFVEWFGN